MTIDSGLKCLANSLSNKEDKKAKDGCLVCQKPATDDMFECIWCENHQYCHCSKISADDCYVLNNIVGNMVFFVHHAC